MKTTRVVRRGKKGVLGGFFMILIVFLRFLPEIAVSNQSISTNFKIAQRWTIYSLQELDQNDLPLCWMLPSWIWTAVLAIFAQQYETVPMQQFSDHFNSKSCGGKHIKYTDPSSVLYSRCFRAWVNLSLILHPLNFTQKTRRAKVFERKG